LKHVGNGQSAGRILFLFLRRTLLLATLSLTAAWLSNAAEASLSSANGKK
jgi:hypothetical protein